MLHISNAVRILIVCATCLVLNKGIFFVNLFSDLIVTPPRWSDLTGQHNKNFITPSNCSNIIRRGIACNLLTVTLFSIYVIDYFTAILICEFAIYLFCDDKLPKLSPR